MKNRELWGWASSYWGSHAYATSILAVFFPIFFAGHWDHGSTVTLDTFRLGLANSVAALVVALSAPVLGAIADRGGCKKRFLIATALLGALMVLGLRFVPMGRWQWAWLLYVVASSCYWWGNLFGDSMLVSVAPPGRLDMTSAIGYFAGYAGGGLFLLWGVVSTLKPQWFGSSSAAAAVELILVLTAAWWAVFSLPLLWWVPEPHRPDHGLDWLGSARAGVLQLAATFRQLRAFRPALLFLVAYWVYIDGVNTVILMAVDYGKAIGFPTADLILAVLLVQFIGAPAALVFGRLGERIGPKPAIFIGLAAYTAVTLLAAFMTQAWQFFVLAALIGLVQGGVQLLSRSYYARLVPAGRAGEFFGFYDMLGEFAAIIGPAAIGLVSYLSASPRLSILSVIPLFAVGTGLLMRVRTGRDAAAPPAPAAPR